jgi:hypothetical protein
MEKKRLTLSRPIANTHTVKVAEQTFSHGRKRQVVVESRNLGAGTYRELVVSTKPVPALAPHSAPPYAKKPRLSPSEKRQHNKIRHQRRVDALEEQKRERTRWAIEIEKERRAAQPPPSAIERTTARDPTREKAREENLKDKVAQLCQLLVSYQAPELRDKEKAKALRNWLYTVRTKDWAQKDRVRVEFALEVLNAVVAGRKPAEIEVPSGGYFRWPSTKADGLSSSSIDAPEHDLGVLGAMGYRVGLKGLDTALRRSLLGTVYHKRLQVNLPGDYLEEWGQPQTARRLKKLANTLASLTRNMKRRERPSQEAIEQWQADLEFLRKSFYVGRYDFKWPSL